MKTPLHINLSPGLWLQAFALLFGGCALLASQERAVYLGALFIFTAVGVIGLVRCILLSSRVTTWDLLLVSVCLGYGLGSLNTELTWLRMPIDYLRLTWAGPAFIAKATAWVMLAGVALCVASSLDTNRVLQGIRIDAAQRPMVLWLVLAVAALSLAQVATGAIGYHSDITGDGVNISPLAALTVGAICPAAALASFSWKDQHGWQRGLMLLGLAVLLLIEAFQGRRVFIYSVVVCLMCFFAAHPPKRLFTASQILSFAIAALMVMGASKAFFALRIASTELGSTRDTAALLRNGFDILMNAQRASLNEAVSDNQNSRTFIVGYLAELVEALENREPLHGDVLMFDVALNVPAALWPEKYKILSLGAEEAVANPALGMPLSDEANSIVTTGASDFGIAGIFAYPLALAGIYSLILWSTRRLGGAAHLMITAALVNTLLNVEAATADYFGILRSIVIVIVGALGIWLAYRMLIPPTPVPVSR
jgi:hypothetical protein